jgi:hypothetical protein
MGSLHAQGSRNVGDGLPYVDVEKTVTGIPYVAGGIGANEQDRLNERASDFNLKLVFTLKEGNYLADVNVPVKDHQGRTSVQDVAGGPFFFARMPAGQYTVAATYDGRTVTRKVNLGNGLHTEYLRWPSNPLTDDPGPSRW